MTSVFPIIIIVLSYGASTVYLAHFRWFPAIYWGCAGTLNVAVLMMSK